MKKLEWDDFDVFSGFDEKYLPQNGEGETLATQLNTAITKLVYKYFNDGDVFDNTYSLEGWANDLSSYANWIYKHMPNSRGILDRIKTISYLSEYVELLWDLCCELLNPKNMRIYNEQQKEGTIYECDGPYKYKEPNEEEDY